jgi:23S rRNA (adenine2503-C2)-methyltransferase
MTIAIATLTHPQQVPPGRRDVLHSTDLYAFTRRELADLLAGRGFAPAAGRLWRYLYRDAVASLAEMTDLPPDLRSRLEAEATLSLPRVAVQADSADGCTRKYLLQLADGSQIETVRMRFRAAQAARTTACLSTQAGCPLGCVFCATGQAGFSRNLSAGEIVAQAVHVQRSLLEVRRIFNPSETECNSVVHLGTECNSVVRPGTECNFVLRLRTECNSVVRLRNIVLMGMGEPLLNYDAVMRAIDILRDSSGLAIAGKRITLSTVGVVPGIIRLAGERRPCSLAVSLHAATQEERAALVPAARTWPLDELIEACRYYTEQLDRRIFFEWTLIDGQNDSPDHAQALARLVAGLPAHINLIPLNLTAGYAGQPTPSPAATHFQSILRAHGLPATFRQRRGLDIAAGCGQLAGSG